MFFAPDKPRRWPELTKELRNRPPCESVIELARECRMLRQLTDLQDRVRKQYAVLPREVRGVSGFSKELNRYIVRSLKEFSFEGQAIQ